MLSKMMYSSFFESLSCFAESSFCFFESSFCFAEGSPLSTLICFVSDGAPHLGTPTNQSSPGGLTSWGVPSPAKF